MIRIHVDFNSRDEEGRVQLNTFSLANHEGSLTEELTVMLYEPDDFEVQATLVFDEGWMAVPDFSTLRYLDGSEGP